MERVPDVVRVKIVQKMAVWKNETHVADNSEDLEDEVDFTLEEGSIILD